MPETIEPKTKDPIATSNRSNGFRRLVRLARKELVEILRDRRTIITLVLMPLLLYPLLGITMQKFMVRAFAGETQDKPISLVVESTEKGVKLEEVIRVGHQIVWFNENRDKAGAQKGDLPNGSKKTSKQGTESKTVNGNRPSKNGKTAENDGANQESSDEKKILDQMGDQMPKINLFVRGEEDAPIEEMIATGGHDLGVLMTIDRAGRPSFQLLHLAGSSESRRALDFISERLEAVNRQWVRRILRQRRISSKLPAEYQPRPIEVKNSSQPSLLTFIPLMLVLMTMTGAVYPAIDLTAGERERGTMEILVAAPVSRMALLFGKFVAVLGVAMLTAIVNLIAMFLTVYTLGLETLVFGDAGLSPSVVLLVLGLLLIFAAFFSATLLGFTSFARSFKEAQAYLIPLMLVSLMPGMISLAPNMELTPVLAVVPLVNIVMLSRDLLAGSAQLAVGVITVVSTLLYGVMALGVASRIFGADSILAGGGNSWSDFLRRSKEPTSRPLISTAMLLLAVLFPSFIVIGGLAGRLGGTISDRLMINAGVTFCLFVILPIIFVRLFHLRFKSSFQLRGISFSGLAAALLLGGSVWVLVYELEIYSLSGARIQELQEMFASLKIGMAELPLGLKLMCLAVAPAVCEEFTFRGFLFSAFRGRVSDKSVVLITAVLFGLFHVFVRDALFFERMLPTTLMGILLGYVCLKTGSVLPGMILHVIHNGLLLTIGHFEEQLTDWGIGISEQQHLPLQWILIALVPMVVGLLILIQHRPPKIAD